MLGNRTIVNLILFCIPFMCIKAQTLRVKCLAKAERDLSARINVRTDNNGQDCALLKVQLAQPNAEFKGLTVGTVAYKTSEYQVYLSPLAKNIRISLQGYLPLDVVFNDYGYPKLDSRSTYIMVVELPNNENGQHQRASFKNNGVYIEGNFQIGNYMSFGGSLGVYYSNVNVEIDYLAGTFESEEIFWNVSASTGALLPTSYTYKPTSIGCKVGYGFLFTNNIRFTPQIGVNVISLKGSQKNRGETVGVDETFVSTASIGARFHIALVSIIGISISPEYSFGLAKGKAFDSMAETSNKIKHLEGGFNCKFGINIFF